MVALTSQCLHQAAGGAQCLPSPCQIHSLASATSTTRPVPSNSQYRAARACSQSQGSRFPPTRYQRRSTAPKLQQLKKELLDAVHTEQYAQAASLRDRIKQEEEANPVLQLQLRLKQAVAEQNFQEAASIRDEIVAATPARPPTQSDTVTNDVRVQVKSKFWHSAQPSQNTSYVWSYRIRITNQSPDRTVTLQTRHWIIIDDDGHREEVRGPGVIGEQPMLPPGHSFEYSSYSQLRTPRGTMEGSYEFVDETPAEEGREDTLRGRQFEVAIGKFGLDSSPGAESGMASPF
ncbi:hypothetical protein WJX73_004217 [Symbiochloris irregularis]|uniref:ApaG domain-containing protein n=1 Tax=Symbiochloris irregularis TaxID=706552 RepID=A0AAW1PEN3_9CHLO